MNLSYIIFLKQKMIENNKFCDLSNRNGKLWHAIMSSRHDNRIITIQYREFYCKICYFFVSRLMDKLFFSFYRAFHEGYFCEWGISSRLWTFVAQKSYIIQSNVIPPLKGASLHFIFLFQSISHLINPNCKHALNLDLLYKL